MDSNGNGTTNKVLWWVIASIAGPVLLGVLSTLMTLTISATSRTAVLEAEFQDLARRLGQIEGKLDTLITRDRK